MHDLVIRGAKIVDGSGVNGFWIAVGLAFSVDVFLDRFFINNFAGKGH